MWLLAFVIVICSMLLSHSYMSLDFMETFWWNILCTGIVVNIVLLVKCEAITNHEKRQKVLSSLFILSNTIRSVFPRIDVERICYFDSILSTTIVGRSLATGAEIALSLQIATNLLHIMKDSTVRSFLPYILPPAICIAQILCWIGVLTTNQLFHVFEESIWAVFFAMLIPLLLQLSRSTASTETKNKLLGCTILATIYVIYMVYIDIPMYYGRYAENKKLNIPYLSLTEGIYDVASCKRITKSYEVWQEDSVWMIGYFVFGSLISVGMIKG